MLDDRLADLPIAVLDVETTGLRPQFGHRVVEIAVVTAKGKRIQKSWSTLVNPGRPMQPEVEEIHGISAEMLRGQPAFAEILPQLTCILKGRALVAHNAPFDLGFLDVEFRRAGARFGADPVLDTLPLARRWYDFTNNTLTTIAGELGVRTPRHRALADVRATLDVFRAFVADFEKNATVADWIDQQGGPGWTPPAPALPSEHPLDRALGTGEATRVRYTDGWGNETVRTIEPQVVIGRYLHAFCRMRGEVRTFRLDRLEVVPTSDPTGRILTSTLRERQTERYGLG